MDDVIKAILKKWCLDPYCIDAMKEYALEQSKADHKRIKELEVEIASLREAIKKTFKLNQS
jgi:hypothetical protein